MEKSRNKAVCDKKKAILYADGKIYFTAENGEIYIVQAGPEFKLLSVNKMNEICMATPAISQGTLFFRTRNHLVAVSEQ